MSDVPSLPVIDVGHGLSVHPLDNDGSSITLKVTGLPCGSNFAVVRTDGFGFAVQVAPVSESLDAVYKFQTAPCVTNPQIGI